MANQGYTTERVILVNEFPVELYNAAAEDKSLLDLLEPNDVKSVKLNPDYFKRVPAMKGKSTDPDKVISTTIENRVGIIGIMKHFSMTWSGKKILFGFHEGWYENGLPKWHRMQFNNQGIREFRGSSPNDQADWLVLQLHPEAKQDVVATYQYLVKNNLEKTKANLNKHMISRRKWTFEFTNPDVQGMDAWAIFEREQEVNEKIKNLQDGHLQVLMSAETHGYKFLNQPTLAKSITGARGYLVNRTKSAGGYDMLRKLFVNMEHAIEVDQLINAVKANKIKITQHDVIRVDNGKVYVASEEVLQQTGTVDEQVLSLKSRFGGTDGYKELAVYVDELSKSTKATAKGAKLELK